MEEKRTKYMVQYTDMKQPLCVVRLVEQHLVTHRHLGSEDWHITHRIYFREPTEKELAECAVYEL